MLKSLVFAAVLAFTSSALATEYNSCLVQLLKNNTNDQKAHFVLACDGEVLATHETTPTEQLSQDQINQAKAAYSAAVFHLIGQSADAKCFEQETELFWFSFCHK